MLKSKKQEYINIKSIAYLSNYGIVAGIELKEIEYGIHDYAIIVFGTNITSTYMDGKTVHRLKINYCTKTPYIKFLGYRIKMDNFIKI